MILRSVSEISRKRTPSSREVLRIAFSPSVLMATIWVSLSAIFFEYSCS
jgi:hypothetical protein